MEEDKTREKAKAPYHSPQLIVIRGRETAQSKSGYQIFEGGKPKPGSEHRDGNGVWHGTGTVGPS